MDKSKHLGWIDLEMTGLDANRDLILEIAALVTDTELNLVATGPDLIIHQSSTALDRMIPVVREMHQASGLTAAVLASSITLAQAEQQVLAFFTKYAVPGTMPLCGNSIWQDKIFLINYMPNLINFFHYRTIDVSTIKELVCRWYGVAEFKKVKQHRALSDIKESVAELKFYKENYFIKKY